MLKIFLPFALLMLNGCSTTTSSDEHYFEEYNRLLHYLQQPSPTPSIGVQAQIVEHVHDTFNLAYELYGIDLHKYNIPIFFDATRSLEGQSLFARTHDGDILLGLRFNEARAQYDIEEMLHDTIPHEVAHLITYLDTRLGKNHNRDWMKVCKSLSARSRCRKR